MLHFFVKQKACTKLLPVQASALSFKEQLKDCHRIIPFPIRRNQTYFQLAGKVGRGLSIKAYVRCIEVQPGWQFLSISLFRFQPDITSGQKKILQG